jgi:very-short-patch-repair endonuclease
VPSRPKRPAELTGTVFRARDAVAGGLLTKRQLSSGAWRPLFRGIYADADLPVDHALRCLGAHLLMPTHAAIAGASAAYLHGAKIVDSRAPVEVVVPWRQRFGPVKGLRIRFAAVPPADVSTRKPRSTTPLRTAYDIAMGRDLVEAVVLLDALAQAGVLRRAHVEPLRERLAAARGGRRGLRALDLHDPAAESPQESRLRVRLVSARVPRPVSQHVVRDPSGRFIARVDLAWPGHKVAVEYDGVWHADAKQLRHDRRRLNQLVAAGWTVLHVTDDRLRHHLDEVAAEILACLARRS